MAARSDLTRLAGHRIATFRQRAGLSQRELAERLGWSRDIIAHYELGRRELSLERLAIIAQGLQISPATLLAPEKHISILLLLDSRPELVEQVAFFLTAIEHDDELQQS
jgi:transcriptional regulator with XRE-family HTH domain